VHDGAISRLQDLVRDLNQVARSVLEEDGEHAAMFFLHVHNTVETRLFSDTAGGPVGHARGREIVEAVRATGADAVVYVSQAWRAASEAVPVGGSARDAVNARDVLLVAGTDRYRNSLIVETPIFRRPDGTLRLGDGEEYEDDYVLNFLSPVQRIWDERR
jgi:hypothetical protein